MRIAPSVDEDKVIELCLREVGECADTMRLVIDAMVRCFDTLQLDDRRLGLHVVCLHVCGLSCRSVVVVTVSLPVLHGRDITLYKAVEQHICLK